MALSGIHVLDLTRVLAGPYATMLLSDLGATVHKLERPKTGDDTRQWGPPFIQNPTTGESVSTYYLGVNRGKKSLAINLQSEDGRAVMQRMLPHYDVLIHNYLPSQAKKLGIDYSSTSTINPRLIHATISGYGPTGPMKDKGGYDVLISAAYGLMDVTGDPSAAVGSKAGVAATDIMTGCLTCNAVIAQLFRRDREGGESRAEGSEISASLMESQLSMLTNVASSALNAPPPPQSDVIEPSRFGNAHESIVPYQTFTCKGGGNLVLCGMNDKQFTELYRTLFNTQITPPQYKTNPLRVKERLPLIDLIERKMLERTRGDWIDHFDSLHVSFPFAPVRTVREAFECEQAVERKVVINLDHPGVGSIKVVKHPVSHSGVINNEEMTAPPRLGQHSREILRDVLGMPDEEIMSLKEAGVVELWGE
jgi:succinate--hydroxymethylglutarate CoA-transferase